MSKIVGPKQQVATKSFMDRHTQTISLLCKTTECVQYITRTNDHLVEHDNKTSVALVSGKGKPTNITNGYFLTNMYVYMQWIVCTVKYNFVYIQLYT